MRYNLIRKIDIANGNGTGVALFVQGCHFHCENCFNTETWDFNGGNEWNDQVKTKFLELANNSRIKRISLLGGECLEEENLNGILDLVNEIHNKLPNKTIWLYTGFEWDFVWMNNDTINKKRQEIISKCNVLVDGRYIESKKNPSLKFRGSSNQRIIDIQESLKQNKVILYCD